MPQKFRHVPGALSTKNARQPQAPRKIVGTTAPSSRQEEPADMTRVPGDPVPIIDAPIPGEIRARLARATVRLSGSVGHPMVASFFDQLLPVLEVDGAILVELFTDGGDAEIGRRLAEEVRLLRQQHGRDMWFLGKTLVASAGVTVMAAFPKAKRWLTRDAALLIHGRRMTKDLHLEGPLGSCRRVLEEMIADIDHGLRLEQRGFAELIEGSNVDAEEAARRAYGGWYLSAEEALSRGLVAGLV
jgi:ATP-dependent protease ClpP protease subunit